MKKLVIAPGPSEQFSPQQQWTLVIITKTTVMGLSVFFCDYMYISHPK